MPREISLFDAYIPTILLLAIAAGIVTLLLDRVLTMLGWYKLVWHPALFRVSLFACLVSLFGLSVYQ